ncbi:hypothetical protein Pan110_53260 [Gimesia panareensis]|nr:hypothetical protein Pan110_53260 [Gimesia panareensis]
MLITETEGPGNLQNVCCFISPWENSYIESFNGKLRDELLSGEIFNTLWEAKGLIERWMRGHSSISRTAH